MPDATATTDGWFDVWAFLLFSHGWTWLWWSVPVLAGWHAFRFPGVVFLVVGGLGVTLGGVGMTWLVGGRRGLRELWRRLVDPGLVPSRWYLAVLFVWPALAVGGALLANVTGETRALSVEPLVELSVDPLALFATLLGIFLLGPLPEEIGWRGYWLDRLQRRWSALTASLVLGVAWAVWHAPLFVMVGYFSSWEFSPAPLPFAFNIVVAAVLYTWVYNNARRSVLAVVLFHFLQNATGQLLELSPRAESFQTILTVGFALAVIGWWGPRRLQRVEHADG
ncbi:CPBP family intramembrane glutamic endopeptidase [Halobacterium wangiae]|uniref:CPBP family intramembrane glutamic endopeptidase n=1 Tax=Halobacterium wangiae TaxID=2902623 RepID=UPI001E37BB8B|nr:CPBP family intramembrane glutamic endopeptidase [Halobacterium wangiae]